MDWLNGIPNIFSFIPTEILNWMIVLLVAYAGGNLAWIVANMLNYQVTKIVIDLNRKNSKRKGRKSQKERSLVTQGGAIYHPAVFATSVTPNDIYGMSQHNWELYFAAAGGIGAILGVATSPDDAFTGLLYGLIIGISAMYGLQKFYRYLRVSKTRKDAMDTMDMLQEQLIIERNSLNNAMNKIKDRYIQHVLIFGKDSWYYQNFVLGRMVFLISTQPGFVPQELLKQLGDELGEVDSIRRIVSTALSRMGQSGDAGLAIKEQITSYYDAYYSDLHESIPQLSDKLFVPIMVTHFMPFLIILLWPIVETIYAMMGADVMSGEGMDKMPKFFGGGN